MSAVEHAASAAIEEVADDGNRTGHGIRFWIHRYLPAEIVGTAALILAGFGVTAWTDAPAVIAIAALIGESIGFYAVLAFTVYLEQIRVVRPGRGITRSRRRAGVRTLLLLAAEFGPSELLDSLVIRPAALVLGVWLIPDPFWGLLAGKVVADIVFYAIAAGAFTVTDRTGLRGATEENAS